VVSGPSCSTPRALQAGMGLYDEGSWTRSAACIDEKKRAANRTVKFGGETYCSVA